LVILIQNISCKQKSPSDCKIVGYVKGRLFIKTFILFFPITQKLAEIAGVNVKIITLFTIAVYSVNSMNVGDLNGKRTANGCLLFFPNQT